MTTLSDVLQYFALTQPDIKYSPGARPPHGWTFNSLSDLKAKTKTFVSRCGYDWRIQSKGTSNSSVYFRCSSSGCKCRWTASECSLDSILAPSGSGWHIKHPSASASAHNHPLKTPSTIHTEPVDIDVIWIGLSSEPLVASDGSGSDFAVRFSTPGGDERLESDTRKKIAREAYKLRDELGVHYVTVQGDSIWVHEMLVLALASTTLRPNLHLLHAWKWDKNLLSKMNQYLPDLERETLIMLGCPTIKPAQRTITRKKFWEAMKFFKRVNSNIQVFPQEVEAECEEGKIGDMAIIRDMAHYLNGAGMTRLGYCPRVCLGLGRCKLPYDPAIHTPDSLMVVKQSQSCGGDGVKILPLATRHNLKCTTNDTQSSPLVNLERHYFHQEHVRSLGKLECRTFVAFNDNPEAQDGLVPPGTIAYMVATAPTSHHSTAKAKSLESCDLAEFCSDGTAAELKLEEIKQYVMLMHAALLRTGREEMSSLRTITRFDTGLSDCDERFVFINEIVRGYKASQFVGDTDIRAAELFVSPFCSLVEGIFCSRRYEV